MEQWLQRREWRLTTVRLALRVARCGSGDFYDGIRQLAHGTYKSLDDRSVKLRIGAALQFGKSLVGSPAFFVGAIARDGVVSVGHGDDARTKRNAFSRQSIGIT